MQNILFEFYMNAVYVILLEKSCWRPRRVYFFMGKHLAISTLSLETQKDILHFYIFVNIVYTSGDRPHKCKYIFI